MIDLTPLEVRQKKGDFSKGLRGYDPGEVDDFLALVADRLEALVKENMGLKDRFGRLEEQLDEFKRRERALTDALVTAQQMREEVRKQSSREAEILMKEAQQEAERVRAGAAQAREKEEEILRRLRARQSQLIQSYRTFLERELTELAIVADTLGATEDEPPRRKQAKPKSAAPTQEEPSPAPSSPPEEVAVGSFAAELATLAGSTRAPAEAKRAGSTRAPAEAKRAGSTRAPAEATPAGSTRAPAEATPAGSTRAPAEPTPAKNKVKARTPRDVIAGPEDVVPADVAPEPEAGAPEDLLPAESVSEEPEEREPEAEAVVPESEPTIAESEEEPWASPAGTGPEATEDDELQFFQLEEPEGAEGEEAPLEAAPEDEYALAMEIEEELDGLRASDGTGNEPMPWDAEEGEEADEGPDPWAEALDFGLEQDEEGAGEEAGEQLELDGEDAEAGGATDEQDEKEEGDEPDWLSSILKEKP